MAIAVVRRRSPDGRRIARGSQLFGALVASAVAVVALAAASLLHPVGSTATLSLVVASLLGLPFAEPTTAPAVPEPTPSGPAPSGVVTTPEPGGSSPTPTPDAQTLLDTARRRSAEGAYDEAVTHYRAFLSLYPEDARQLDARVELGRLLVDRGEAEAALPVLQEPLDGEPDEPHRSRLAFLLGRALQQLDRAPEAEARYRQAAESSDLLAPYAWVRVGVSAITRGDA
ncbi:MAG TPA: tetratricopeptide repeat protein, partial [Chloroflexota bacterium]